jgi:hypothetical protein
MKSQPDKLSTTLSGISGEYFVAAELSRHGLIAAVTLRNSRGIDILASYPGRKNPASIQVKTLQRRGKQWLLSKSDERSKGKHHYYVFVALNGRDGRPEYHVVEGDIVAKRCAASHKKWLRGRKRDGGKRKDSNMRVFEPGKEFGARWNRIRFD